MISFIIELFANILLIYIYIYQLIKKTQSMTRTVIGNYKACVNVFTAPREEIKRCFK